MSNRNRELKTVAKVITSGVSLTGIGGRVPVGMKRWVTFLMIDSYAKSKGSTIGFYFASVSVSKPAIASTVLAANRKLFVPIFASGLNKGQNGSSHPLMLPASGPDPENPLFSILGGKWLGVFASLTTGHVFMQYFDE